MLSVANLIPPTQTGSQLLTEDTYTMPSDSSGITNSNRIVKFICPNKGARVRAIMNNGFDFNVTSQWSPLTEGGLVGLVNSGVNKVNKISSSFGVSVSQPWQNRKIYNSTSPLSFTVNFNLMATNDARKEVWEPAMTLISFLYPREIDVKTLDGNENMVLSGLGKAANFVDTMKNAGQTVVRKLFNVPQTPDGTSVLDTALNAFKVYSVPGPSLIYRGSSTELGSGDPVEVFLGQKIALGNCYLENISIKFDDVADEMGYPLSAECSAKIACADNLTVKQNGGFMVSQLSKPNEELSNLIDALGETVQDLVKDGINIFTKTLDSWKILVTGGL